MRSHICVGGPLSGRRYQASGESGFYTPVCSLPAASFADPAAFSDSPVAPIPVELTRYRAETFHTPEGPVIFWVPEGQTALQTITLLLEVFEQHSVHKRVQGGR